MPASRIPDILVAICRLPDIGSSTTATTGVMTSSTRALKSKQEYLVSWISGQKEFGKVAWGGLGSRDTFSFHGNSKRSGRHHVPDHLVSFGDILTWEREIQHTLLEDSRYSLTVEKAMQFSPVTLVQACVSDHAVKKMLTKTKVALDLEVLLCAVRGAGNGLLALVYQEGWKWRRTFGMKEEVKVVEWCLGTGKEYTLEWVVRVAKRDGRRLGEWVRGLQGVLDEEEMEGLVTFWGSC